MSAWLKTAEESRNNWNLAPDVQDNLAQTDDFEGDVAEAVHAQQLPVVSGKGGLQQAAVTGDGSARGAAQVAAPHDVGHASSGNLLLGGADPATSGTP